MAAVAVILVGGPAWAMAQPGPKVVDVPPKVVPVNPGSVRSLEEAVETLEAQLETKRAYVKAAQASLTGAEEKLKLTTKLVETGAARAEELGPVRAERDVAAAMVEVRKAELNEVAVRLKHARRRLEDAGGKPAVGPDPKKQPAQSAADVKELEAAVARLEAKRTAGLARIEQAKANLARAKAALDRVKEAATKGIVPREEYAQAAAAVEEAQAEVKIAEAAAAEVDTVLKAAKKQFDAAKAK
jgi:multidrug resistance efflux pump